jgi:hypothetical protein
MLPIQRLLKRVPLKYLPSHVIKPRPSIYEAVGLCFVLLLFGLLLWEWLSIDIIAIPEKIAEYHFGSESMVGEGGAHYASASAYAQSALSIALFPLLPLVIVFGMAVIKNNAFYRILAWASLLVTLLVNFLS